MTGKFKIRDLMIHVAPDDDDQDEPCPRASAFGQSDCPGASCEGPDPKAPPPRRDKGPYEPARSNLALLQKELRQALDLGR